MRLAHVSVSGFAVLSDAVVLAAAGTDGTEDLRIEDLALEDGILEGGVVLRPDDQPGSASIEGLRIAGVDFVATVRANVGVELNRPATVSRVDIHDVSVTAGELGEAHLLGLPPGAALDGASIHDVAITGGGSLVHVDAGLLDGADPVVITDAALGVSTGGVAAVAVDAVGGATLEDVTLVSLFPPLITGSLLSTVTVTRGLLVSSGSIASQRVELADTVVVGPAPPRCRPLLTEACCDDGAGCTTATEPGLLRFDPYLPADLWDLRQRAGAPGCPATTLPVAARGGLRRGDTDPSWYPDTDGDHLLDDWELAWLGPLAAVGAGDDADGDGLSNRCELEATGSLPHLADTDSDGLLDGADATPLRP
jgi:hypothetical protein